MSFTAIGREVISSAGNIVGWISSRKLRKRDTNHGISISAAARWPLVVSTRLTTAAHPLLTSIRVSSAGDESTDIQALTRSCVALARSKAARHRTHEVRWTSTVSRSGLGLDSKYTCS